MGVDPFASTYKWLERAFNRVKNQETTGWYQTPANSNSLTILHEAYCELLLWNPKNPFPEVIEQTFPRKKSSVMLLLII